MFSIPRGRKSLPTMLKLPRETATEVNRSSFRSGNALDGRKKTLTSREQMTFLLIANRPIRAGLSVFLDTDNRDKVAYHYDLRTKKMGRYAKSVVIEI